MQCRKEVSVKYCAVIRMMSRIMLREFEKHQLVYTVLTVVEIAY